MSPDARARRRRTTAYVALAIGVVVTTWFGGWAANRKAIHRQQAFARSLCLDVARSRKQGNARANVIRTFLLVAASTRAASAELEHRGSPKQATNDLRAARLYRDLASQVHTLPAPTC